MVVWRRREKGRLGGFVLGVLTGSLTEGGLGLGLGWKRVGCWFVWV